MTTPEKMKREMKRTLIEIGLAPYLDMKKVDAEEIDPLYSQVTCITLPLPKPKLEEIVIRDGNYDFILKLENDRNGRPVDISNYRVNLRKWKENLNNGGSKGIKECIRQYLCCLEYESSLGVFPLTTFATFVQSCVATPELVRHYVNFLSMKLYCRPEEKEFLPVYMEEIGENLYKTSNTMKCEMWDILSLLETVGNEKASRELEIYKREELKERIMPPAGYLMQDHVVKFVAKDRKSSDGAELERRAFEFLRIKEYQDLAAYSRGLFNSKNKKRFKLNLL